MPDRTFMIEIQCDPHDWIPADGMKLDLTVVEPAGPGESFYFSGVARIPQTAAIDARRQDTEL